MKQSNLLFLAVAGAVAAYFLFTKKAVATKTPAPVALVAPRVNIVPPLPVIPAMPSNVARTSPTNYIYHNPSSNTFTSSPTPINMPNQRLVSLPGTNVSVPSGNPWEALYKSSAPVVTPPKIRRNRTQIVHTWTPVVGQPTHAEQYATALHSSNPAQAALNASRAARGLYLI